MCDKNIEKYILSIPLICHTRDKFNLRKYDLMMNGVNQSKMKDIINDFHSSLTNNNNDKIPHIIHQIWIGNKPPPHKWINTWKQDYLNEHKDWEYILWDDEKLNELDMINKDVYLNELTYNGKSDIARYEILYKFGGVYIDADSVWLGTKSLSPLCDESGVMFAGMEPTQDYIASSVVGSPKGHPNLLLIINAIRKNYEMGNTKRFLQWITMGPLVLHVLENNGLPIRRLPEHIFYPEYWHNKKLVELSEEKKKEYGKQSIMHQYGYTTNGLGELMNT